MRTTSLPRIPAKNRRPGAPRRVPRTRRGVAAVLSMMFLILFGSLAAAMAIASKGNLTTAATHLRVLRAQGAAETGLGVAQARLRAASQRFVISQSLVDASFGWNFWTGNLGALGTYNVLPSKTGRLDLGTPTGLASALAQLHGQDQDLVLDVGVSTPTIGNAVAGASTSTYRASNWLYTPAVAIEPRNGGTIPPVCYQVTYAPLANGTDVRVIVSGYDFSYERYGQPIVRTVMQDFRMSKRVNNAIVSPTRVMVGKNVHIDGDLGSTYTQTSAGKGDPMLVRSDFYGLDAVLDQKLDLLFAGIKLYDVDGDNRLRVRHPIETQGVPSNSQDFNGDGQPDNAFTDVTGDTFVDDFDTFINHFDASHDGRLALPWSGDSSVEFAQDPALAYLVDSTSADRNRNGVYGYTDANHNGRWDTGEVFADFDPLASGGANANRDQVLGYIDGYIDYKDQYAKINGGLSFRATRSQWATDQGDISQRLRGGYKPTNGQSAQQYAAGTDTLPNIDGSSFVNTRDSLQSAADGQTFDQQVASNLGISVAALPTYTETQSAGTGVKRYLRVDPDANLDGLPDNHATAYFERMPYAAPAYADVYFRPVYENMTFKDVTIPAGNNGYFVNCTFVGVTFVRAALANDHVLWGEYGKLVMDAATARPKVAFPRSIYGDTAGESSYPDMLPSTAVPPDQMILMATTPLDKADLPANVAAITLGYDQLPDPLVIAGKRVTDTKAFSNNLRFHDCLFVGSVVSDSPASYCPVRNKVQFTGSTRFTDRHPDQPDDAGLNPDSVDAQLIASSSMMLPQYSVDVGMFNSPQSQNVQLHGAIVAGVIDVRGNTSIDGSLLLTFNPVLGQGPLRDALGNPVGNPADFNVTLGYFGSNDGDEESTDPNTLPLSGGQRLVGYDTNGDGIADPGATTGTPVYFNGYGAINIHYNPEIALPNGLMIPMQVVPLMSTYREGKL